MEELKIEDAKEYVDSLFNELEMMHTENSRSNVYKRLKLYDDRLDMTDGNVCINNEYHCESIDCAAKFLRCLSSFLQMDWNNSTTLVYTYTDPKFSNVRVKSYPKAVNEDGTVDIIIFVDVYYGNNNTEKETTDNNDTEYSDKFTLIDSKGHIKHFKIKGGKIKWRN